MNKLICTTILVLTLGIAFGQNPDSLLGKCVVFVTDDNQKPLPGITVQLIGNHVTPIDTTVEDSTGNGGIDSSSQGGGGIDTGNGGEIDTTVNNGGSQDSSSVDNGSGNNGSDSSQIGGLLKRSFQRPEIFEGITDSEGKVVFENLQASSNTYIYEVVINSESTPININNSEITEISLPIDINLGIGEFGNNPASKISLDNGILYFSESFVNLVKEPLSLYLYSTNGKLLHQLTLEPFEDNVSLQKFNKDQFVILLIKTDDLSIKKLLTPTR